MTDNLLFCKPIKMVGRVPESVCIHRMPMTSTQRPEKELMFIRHQFPVRLSLFDNQQGARTFSREGRNCVKKSLLCSWPALRRSSRAHRQADIAVFHYNIHHPTRPELHDRLHNIVYNQILR
ncbi:hypothetical protein L596_016487 [Steinernema carpocapsae]|uniref:Uncharacterized protein n=1 Tax=Steinernema carpocapsae TaxID=34508 RepID=A0A4U5NI48_STECR|nr:hypothetical protein L596_016487 [Steinernema carpocapsae]